MYHHSHGFPIKKKDAPHPPPPPRKAGGGAGGSESRGRASNPHPPGSGIRGVTCKPNPNRAARAGRPAKHLRRGARSPGARARRAVTVLLLPPSHPFRVAKFESKTHSEVWHTQSTSTSNANLRDPNTCSRLEASRFCLSCPADAAVLAAHPARAAHAIAACSHATASAAGAVHCAAR